MGLDLREATEDVIEFLAPRAHAKGLELLCQVEESVPLVVRGDPGRLRQVLTNLVGNAVKFTARGEVAVRVRPVVEDRTSLLVGFQVRDTGVGIAPEAASGIFDAFAQADGSTTRRYGGTGLGLAISKQLASLMGGDIDFESRPGQGSTFRFTARFAKAEAPAADLATPRTPLPGLRVLVVDDHPETRTALRSQCVRLGINATTADGGKTAIEELRRAARTGRPYDVVLLDREMPDMDGREVANAIRRDPTTRSTRIILLAALGAAPKGAEESQGDFAAVLSKPVREARLAECLASVVTAAPTPSGARTNEAAPLPEFQARVLLVEDSPVNQAVAEGMLALMGCEVETAEDGREALAALEKGGYDLVLMDCMMPVVDGFEATAELRRREREDPSRTRTSVVALTASAMSGDRERCLTAGMDDYLSKPFREEALRALLARWLSARASGHEEATMPDHVEILPTAKTDTRPDEHGAPSPPAVDVSALEALRALQAPGAPDIRERVIGLYLQQTPQQLGELRAALARQDNTAVERAAHTVKSSSANVGAMRLSVLCRELESVAGDKGGLDVGPRVDAVEAEYARVERELEDCLEGEVA